jgi:hypothetical protein
VRLVLHTPRYSKRRDKWRSLTTTLPPSRFPLCSLCNEPVDLRTAKTDENGKAIHEQCYALKMRPEHIAIGPVSLTCPRCGAEAGQVCDLLDGEVEIVHVERIKAAAAMDAAKKS